MAANEPSASLREWKLTTRTVVTLAGGGILRYRIDIDNDTGGGSGGPVAELTGWLQLGTRSLGVICTDQDELLREPEWCIPYLHHLEPVE